MTKELRPCPRCGASVEINYAHKQTEEELICKAYIVCPDCRLRSPDFVSSTDRRAAKLAMERWNGGDPE